MNLRDPQRSLVVAGIAILGAGTWFWWSHEESPSEPDAPEFGEAPPPRSDSKAGVAARPTYVGTQACVACHETQAKQYEGSHHQHAIENPSADSVLAPFAGETFSHDGTQSKFFKRQSEYLVRTLGPEGKEQDFVVAYTFGYYPLQQYLLDVGGGRLQALTVAWDARPKSQGGQRFFDLYPGEKLVPQHELHWTRPAQNWNFACADCHTTALHKGYVEDQDTFGPSFADLAVGCEACHGPGSRHVAWARGAPLREEQRSKAQAQEPSPGGALDVQNKGLLIGLEGAADWEIAEGARSAAPRTVGANLEEVEVCAPCHSRRQQLREGRTPDEPFLDAYVPELLREGLYHADGQIRDEVYVYGSFLQSRMFHAGVRCSDCHEPHSLELRREGNALCGGCHNAEAYDSAKHHHHLPRKGGAAPSPRSAGGSAPPGEGTACVDCHMPQTTYMEVDPRRDHSLRIPRPAMAAEIGAPDACTGCHRDRTQKWAAERLAEWFGADRTLHYGLVFHAARQGEPHLAPQLIELSRMAHQPAIVRATALQLLANYPSKEAQAALKALAASQEPLIRLGVTQGCLGLAPQERFEVLLPLLSDAELAVRTEATRALSGIPREAVPASQRAQYDRALDQLYTLEKYYADRPEAWLRIAILELGRGHPDRAKSALEKALELDERFVPALVNLADIVRSQGNEEQAQELLQRAVGIDESNAEAWHALGLSLVRTRRMDEALAMLRRAAELRPENSRMTYVYAVALADGGSVARAIQVLREGLDAHPHDRLMLQALMNYAKQVGDRELASEAAVRLAGLGELLPEPAR